MPAKKSRIANLTSAIPQQLGGRFSLLSLLFLSILLLIAGQVGNRNASNIRNLATDIIAPVVSVASKPFEAISEAFAWANGIVQLRAENVALKNANIQLLQWQSVAKNLEAENKHLRSLMNVAALPKSSYIAARIVTDMSGPYVRSALISGGVDQGIKKDQAVINENGLIGRIIETSNRNARVLLLNDINSRIPVMVESSRMKAILVGNNDELPTLSYINLESGVKVGDRVITSGDGGIFPHGIAVGTVIGIKNDVVQIQPFVDAARIEYVNVVDYAL